MESDVVNISMPSPSLDINYNFKKHILAYMFRSNLPEKKTGSLYLFIRFNVSIGAHVCPSGTDVIFYKNHLGC